MKELLEKLIMEGGIIRSSKDFDELDIRQAQASDRMWVDENGYGFIWHPCLEIPVTDEMVKVWEEKYAKYFPLPDDRPMPEKLHPDKIWAEIKKRDEEMKLARKN